MVFSQKNLTGSCFIIKKLWLGPKFFNYSKAYKNAEKNTRGLGRVFFIFFGAQFLSKKDGFGGLQNSSFGVFLPSLGSRMTHSGAPKTPNLGGIPPVLGGQNTPIGAPNTPNLGSNTPISGVLGPYQDAQK